MKVKIEFDTDINDSFDEMGDSQRDVAARVLRHLAQQFEEGRFVAYNAIEKGPHYPIGMFSVEKK
jgi:hypothetical protein